MEVAIPLLGISKVYYQSYKTLRCNNHHDIDQRYNIYIHKYIYQQRYNSSGNHRVVDINI